jgi:hypothetical protein
MAGLSGAPGVPEGPVFHPTKEEFRDPIAYIRLIRPEAERFGFCKIVPPTDGDWNVPFSLDKKVMRFQTRKQNVAELQQRSDEDNFEDRFLEAFAKYLESQQKVPTKQCYIVLGTEVPLARLFRLVARRGGYSMVSDTKGGWREVAAILKVRPFQFHLCNLLPSSCTLRPSPKLLLCIRRFWRTAKGLVTWAPPCASFMQSSCCLSRNTS